MCVLVFSFENFFGVYLWLLGNIFISFEHIAK